MDADQGPSLVVRKNAEARRLAAKGKLRDALNVLNDAIYATPGYPHLYASRAIVFERLGMFPQAEGDRAKALDLARAGGYSEEEVFAEPESPPQRPARAPIRPPPVPRVSVPRVAMPHVPMPQVALPRVKMPPPGSRAELTVVLSAIGGLAAIVVMLFIGASALDDSNVDLNVFDFESFQEVEPSPEASAPAASDATATPPPATPPPEALSGSPFSYTSLEKGWQAKGITVTPGASSADFSGFKVGPFDVNLTGAGGTAALSLLIYANRDDPKEDWDLPAGSRPQAKSGRSLPSHETIWWNTNVVIVVRSTTGDISQPALDAVLNLSP